MHQESFPSYDSKCQMHNLHAQSHCLVHSMVEGIFRINAENSQEELVREQLNRGIVPYGIDVHCLAGLIKALYCY